MPILPITFDPKKYHDAYSVLIASQIYDRLFDIDELLNLKPRLVTSWKNVDNGRKWVLSLRTDVYFHDGKQLTADDLAFTIKRLLEKDSLKKYEFSLIEGADEYREGKSKNVSGVKILSTNSIEITLKEPFPLFISTFAAPNTEIIPANYNGKSPEDFFSHPIGTGPFKFESYTKDNNVTVIANERYFQGRPKLDSIIFEKADTQKALEGFNLGHFHDVEFYFPGPNDMKKSFTIIKTPQEQTNVIVFNNQRTPLNNFHVRKAIAHALDKQQLFNTCFSDQIYAKGYIPPGLGGYKPDVLELKYDPVLAMNELKSAKLKKNDLSRELIFIRPDNHPCKDKFSSFITESLKKIGLNVKVVYMPFNDIISNLEKRSFDMYSVILTADYPEALFMLNTFRSNSAYNPGAVPEYDKLLLEASATQDRFKRYDLYRQAQDILLHNAYIIPLYHGVFSSIFQTYVRGVARNPLTLYLSLMNSIYFSEENAK